MSLQQLLSKSERLKHREHQLVGVDQLVKLADQQRTAEHTGQVFRREVPGVFALFDEVGAGKTKQCVDAAQVLFLRGELDTVVVIAPGSARSTWAEDDPLLGEVAKHAWDSVPNVIHEFHKHYTDIQWVPGALNWLVSNFEFIRREDREAQLLKALRGRRTWIIVDESWNIKGFSDQMRACTRIRRKRAERATILNGTPLADGDPDDLYYQFAFLDPEIIGTQSRTHFRSRYFITQKVANPHGRDYETIIGYQNLEELNARIAPYVLSRKTRDCFDLPPMLDPITIEAKLTPATWKIYCDQRDEMVSFLGKQVSVSRQAIVRALRLAQITSGFLGGLEDVDSDDAEVSTPSPFGPPPPWMRQDVELPVFEGTRSAATKPGNLVRITKEIGTEKLDAYLGWLKSFARPNKMLTWCRFRPELDRTVKALKKIWPNVYELRGKQRPEDREAAKRALAPGGDPSPAAVVGNQKAGGASLNFAASNIAVYMSNGPALIERTQSIGRIERPGASQAMLVVDIVATGPKGQKTIDHHNLKSLRSKDDMARWTVNRWREILSEE